MGYGHSISSRSRGRNFKGKVDMIYEANPEAAKVRDDNNCYPLHIAVSSGKRWDNGVECLLLASPEALSVAATNSKLYPFQLSAIGNVGDLNTTYGLLRAMPNLVTPSKNGTPSSKRRNTKVNSRFPLKKRRLRN